MQKLSFYFMLIICFTTGCKTNQEVAAPDPTRFTNEIASFENIHPTAAKEVVVFTGSSSIRMWKDVQNYYPEYLIINTGFGGSQMSDLRYYLDETVLRFQPKKVFIYEGDNDINDGQSVATIMKYTQRVVKAIEQQSSATEIILISAKPSPARWHLEQEYKTLNRAFADFASKKSNCYYADVWEVMLDEKGMVRTDIFLEDDLHMNRLGYQLWDSVIKGFVEQ